MRGLRTAPVLADIGRDMQELCPDVWMLHYVNPMAINCLALSHLLPDLKYVGLCHSVQGTAADLARDLGEELTDIDYECAGINHVAFYTRFEKRHADGNLEDLCRLHKLVEPRAYGCWDGCTNHVRYEVLKRLGYFVTNHLSILPNIRRGSLKMVSRNCWQNLIFRSMNISEDAKNRWPNGMNRKQSFCQIPNRYAEIC